MFGRVSSAGKNVLWRSQSLANSPNAWSYESSGKSYSTIPPFNETPPPYDGTSKDEVKRLRSTYLNKALPQFYNDPLMIVSGRRQYVFDENGKRYLDAYAGVATVSVGHCHPKVLDAMETQAKKFWHGSPLYLNEQNALYAKELSSRLPPSLSVCHFVNSGSEANDLALLLARLHSGNTDIVALRNSYHGMSHFMMGVTSHSTWRFPVQQVAGIRHAVNPNRYRGPFSYADPDAAEKYYKDVVEVVQHSTPGNVAAFIAEPIQGVGGVIEYPEGYLQKVYEYIRSVGGVCIADEVQTGFGRTGDNYWGFTNHGVLPDIVVMAKGIGNGYPLAAVVTTPEVAECMGKRLHFNTYGGNPIAAAVGRAVLEVIDEENIQENAKVVGGRIKSGFERLQSKYPDVIGDVRGRGMMLGVELVESKEGKEPNAALAVEILEKAKEKGLLLGKGGYFGNVLRIKPVMTMTEADADFLLSVVDEVLEK